MRKNIMPRVKTSFPLLPMTPEEDLILREIYQLHQRNKSATVDDLHKRVEALGIAKFEISLCLIMLRNDGHLIELDGGVYSLTGHGLHHVRFVKPIREAAGSGTLCAALIAGILIWMAEAFTGISEFGDAGSLMVALSVAASITLTLYRRLNKA